MGATCAISRKFLYEIGDFDEGMEKWGGENIDLSIRVNTSIIYVNRS